MLTIEELKSRCTMIHYFGLGFIQIKLEPTARVHVYTEALPATTESIHNHRYNFRSQIWMGSLEQKVFARVPGYTHICEYESCKPGVAAPASQEPCSVEEIMATSLGIGSEYRIAHNTFHQVRSRFAVTYLTRSRNYLKEYAQVIHAVGENVVCPFATSHSEEKLWDIVTRIWKG